MNYSRGLWSAEVAESGRFSLGHAGGLSIEHAGPSATLANLETLAPGPGWDFHACGGDALELEYSLPGRCLITLEIELADTSGWLRLSMSLSNLSDSPMMLEEVCPLSTHAVKSDIPLDRCLRHGNDLCDFTSMYPLGGIHRSHACGAFAHGGGSYAVVLGFASLGESFCHIESKTNPNGFEWLRAGCLREGIALEPRETLTLPPLLLGAGPSLSSLMRQYAEQVAESMGCRCSQVETGWCSWYYYYGSETEADILANVEALAQSPLKDHVRVIQIDDGWNLPVLAAAHGMLVSSDSPTSPISAALDADPDPTHHRVWGDWQAGAKFPHGMRHVADRIREAGFIPGLWLAPFSVDKTSQLRKSHPDWLVQGEDGPEEYWGVYALDLSHPGALGFLRETFARVFDEWGFDYVKIDFLLHAVQPGKRYDPKLTTAQVFRQGLQVIRDVAGERFVLACGAPMGPSVGLCDGMRIGYDVSSRWYVPMNLKSWPSGNCNIRAAAVHTLWRQWMHQVWWQNDPDCLVVRDYGSKPEIDMFHLMTNGQHTHEPPYGLSNEEAAGWVRLVWMTGTMALLSENISELSDERMALLSHSFPLNDAPAHWVDWYEQTGIGILQSAGDRFRVGLFNMGDDTEVVRVPAGKLDLHSDWSFTERMTGETFDGSGATVEFPPLPPHAGRIWELTGTRENA